MKNKIKPFLDSRGVTPYRFRQDAGISPTTAYDLYNNPDQLPSSTVLSKICDAYEVQPSEVLEWVKSEREESYEGARPNAGRKPMGGKNNSQTKGTPEA